MSDVERLAEAVADAARTGRQLHVAGPSEAPDPVALAVRRLRWVLDVDRDGRWVKVQPGATLRHLAESLTAHGLALADLPPDRSLTLADVLAFGAPGTGVDCGSVANQLAAIELIDGTGHLRSLEGDQPLFRAAQVGLGALGVVTQVTLRCLPDYNLAVSLDVRRTDWVLERLEELRSGSGHLQLTWLPGLDRCVVLRAAATDDEPTRQGLAPLSRRLRQSGPALAVAAGGALTHSHRWVDRAHRVLLGELGGAPAALRYALPAETTGQLWYTLRSWLAEHDRIAGSPIRFRFGPGDQAYLSPASGRPTVWVDLPGRAVLGRAMLDRGGTSGEPPDGGPPKESVLGTLLTALGARPQWGDPGTPPAGALAARYPGWSAWSDARRELDPHGVFEPAVPL